VIIDQLDFDLLMIEDVEYLLEKFNKNDKIMSILPDRIGVVGSSVVAETRFNVKSLLHFIGISDISAN